MKASEMTNEELASWLDLIEYDAGKIDSTYIEEAATRLRNVTVRSDNSAVIAELQRRLKVAEDALKECRSFAERYEMDDDYMQSDICSDIRGTVYNALAAICEKGGAK